MLKQVFRADHVNSFKTGAAVVRERNRFHFKTTTRKNEKENSSNLSRLTDHLEHNFLLKDSSTDRSAKLATVWQRRHFTKMA